MKNVRRHIAASILAILHLLWFYRVIAFKGVKLLAMFASSCALCLISLLSQYILADRKSIFNSHVASHEDFAANILHLSVKMKISSNIREKKHYRSNRANYFIFFIWCVGLWIIDSIFEMRSILRHVAAANYSIIAYCVSSTFFLWHTIRDVYFCCSCCCFPFDSHSHTFKTTDEMLMIWDKWINV